MVTGVVLSSVERVSVAEGVVFCAWSYIGWDVLVWS